MRSSLKLNMRKKLIIYIAVAAAYLLIVLIAGLIMNPDLYGVHYEDKFIAPSFSHLFGTDFMGRDMFWRSVKGLSNSILVGLAASAVSAVIALIFGMAAALAGGLIDRAVNWMVDCCMGIPHLVLLLLISYMMGSGGFGVGFAVAVTHWPELTRLVRAEVLQVKDAQYVKASLMMGRSRLWVAKEHVLPHVLPVFLIGLVLLFPHAIMHEASLTFLGFGFSASTPAIGGILSESMKHIVTGKWWLCVFPGLMLLVAVMLFDAIGERLKLLLNPASAHDDVLSRGFLNKILHRKSVAGETENLARGTACDLNAGTAPLLKVRELSVTFDRYDRGLNRSELEVIHSLDVEINAGEIVAVVGSSGSGKSLLAHSILGLLPSNASVSGTMEFEGELLTSDLQEKLRGKDMILIPQSVDFLDPLMKVGKQVQGIHGSRQRVKELFSRYGLANKVEEMYPFQLSGGMARRVLISAGMMEKPRLIIADEPTPGLDLNMARQTLKHLRSAADSGCGVLLITHDIDLALDVADRIAVFYAGTTVEECLCADFLQGKKALRHPYSKAFLDALPQSEFRPIAGTQPYAGNLPAGCLFADRCSLRTAECVRERVDMRQLRGGKVRCIHAD